MRVLAGAGALLVGRTSPAAATPQWTRDIHAATRNTLFGPVGARLWRAPKSRLRAKPYPGAPRIALPEPGPPQTTRAPPLHEVLMQFREASGGLGEEALALSDLARVLHFANGETGQRGAGARAFALRAAPSAGAMYAGELYVVAERVRGLDAGVYYFTPLERALVPLRPGSSRADLLGALERPDAVAKAPAAILLTNVFARYGSRYANRGYRYALIDSGHIGENLRLAARSAGLSDVSPLRFHDERLNALLGVDGRKEAVCALHFIGHPRAATGDAAPVTRHLAEQQVVAPTAPTTSGKITERYHAATSLVPVGAFSSKESTGKDSAAKESFAVRPRRPHPAPLPNRTVEECILRRRSAFAFRDQRLTRENLDWILDVAAGWGELTRTPGVDIALAVHRVEGLAPGLYRFDRAGARLAAERLGDLRQPLLRVCLRQEMVGSCAVAFFMLAPVSGSSSGHDRRYRNLLIETGAVGQRIYLAAEAVGLAARNLAAFRDDELNELLALDGRTRAVLHLTLAGHDASDPVPSA